MEEDRSTIVLAAVAAVGLALLVSAIAFLRRSDGPRAPAPASAQQKAYLPQIDVSDARMSAAQNFLGDTITYLDARVANRGSKTLRKLTLEATFTDQLGQTVLVEKAYVVTARTAPLKPGEARSFQMVFEHMPADWNHVPPRVVAADLEF